MTIQGMGTTSIHTLELLDGVCIIIIIIVFVFQDNNHNQVARKSNDQQIWLPMITAQIWY